MRTLTIIQIATAVALAAATVAAVFFTDSSTLATSLAITAALMAGTANEKRECCCITKLFRRNKTATESDPAA